jgi:hypothetical protein
VRKILWFRFKLLNKLRHFHVGIAMRFLKWEREVLEQSIPQLIVGSKVQKLPHKTLEVHMLVGDRTWHMALWAAKSFQWSTGFCWDFVFQDDGSLSQVQILEMKRMFPAAVVRTRAEADAEMERKLAGRPACLNARKKHFMFLKMFDPYFHSNRDRYLLLDSDVLFFQKPREISDWSEDKNPGFLFDPDVKDSYSIPASELEAFFGVNMFRRANAGLALIPRAGVNLDVVEEYLLRFEKQSVHDLWLEQTAYALLASKWGGVAALLPDTYEISFGAERQKGCVARHYVGTHDSRPHFFREGVITLARELL